MISRPPEPDTRVALNLAKEEVQRYVVWEDGGTWHRDGAHSLDSDLSQTFAILNGLRPNVSRWLVLTLTPDQYGNWWPTFEDVTGQVKGKHDSDLSDGGAFMNIVRTRGRFSRFRTDGWPLCPRCGEDELTSPLMFRYDGKGEKPTLNECLAGRFDCAACGWSR